METFIYALLITTSVIGLTFIVERGLALRWRKVLPREIEAAVSSCHSPDDVPMLRRVCGQYDSPLSRLLLLARDGTRWDPRWVGREQWHTDIGGVGHPDSLR